MMNAFEHRCPECNTELPDGLTINWLGRGPREHGYCPRCSFRFEHNPKTGEHHRTSFAPLCHQCGLETKLDKVRSDEVDRIYHCPDHPQEKWRQQPRDRWQWLGPGSSPSAG